jgi:hypothetical protein
MIIFLELYKLNTSLESLDIDGCDLNADGINIINDIFSKPSSL